VATSTKKIPLVDYAALADDVRARQEQEGLELKQIAARSGVEKSKLSNLVNLRGGLSTDNLLLICDWLGKSLYDYRLQDVPDWVIERIASANDLTSEEAQQLAAERTRTAHRQAEAALALRQLDAASLLAAAEHAAAHR
jgi:transcriptional regulator with XRE-family HTH domain